MSETPDPAKMTQEQLLAFMEHVLADQRHKHPKGSYERNAYEASLGLMFTHQRRSWFDRTLGRFWCWIHTRRMSKQRKATP